MTKSEIEKLFDFSKYYENEEFDVELFDDILLLEEELIPLDRVKEFKKLLVPVWEKEKNLKEIAWYNIDAGRILASWGYKEGLDYLKTLITYGFKDVSTIYPHRLYGYDQVYEYILDAFTNYVLNFSNKGKKKEALKEVYLELCNIIERAKEEFISLSWFKYKMKDSEYYQLFKKPLKDTLDYLKNKEKKSFLDDYNIEDINKALLIKKDIKIKNNTKIKSENIDKHVNEKTEYLKKEFEYFFDKNKYY